MVSDMQNRPLKNCESNIYVYVYVYVYVYG